jgi:biopolymer transport protein ExbD
MKKLILLSLMAIFCASVLATAQSVNVNVKPSEKDATSADKKVVYVNSNDAMSYISLRVKDNLAYFDNLGENSLRVHVTNASGKEIVSRKIDTHSNAFDISAFSKGLYFVTLVNEDNDARKSFTLNL